VVLTHSDLVAFIPTTDVERARGFYVDDLGLQLVESTPYACVLNARGVTVRVTPVVLVPDPSHDQLQQDALLARGWWRRSGAAGAGSHPVWAVNSRRARS